MNQELQDSYDQLLPLLEHLPTPPPLPGQLKPGETAPARPTFDEFLEWTTTKDFLNVIPPWRIEVGSDE